ncbi:zinc finger, LSD1 subclass family protein, putative (macronuclear) [Tetrahymena thermophila SB210]|uniref:Zinc finger, LSD1 subclass family protein, putative n=1 Tax=Tetrahymena thermophila (strain SB210) TaxID=312017 RepID=Q225I9_TETTS|nr:zinc finger, LSD1 subclass family protein, putative [Tetrahymena thermophila SB210]EAR80955.3 zinc finger, LSD1 subclass family protein, putative [Tetrahymena thermophila SB210]|eukprot:XP_001028618.3 zinc finger, LSD1 subclass family protein, putative [Tetrahymena thermophila SB210]
MCTLCQSGYYLLNGQCVQSCPSYTTVSGQQCIDIITKTSYGQYLYKGMFSTYFGEGEISGTGLSYSGFLGYLANPSRAMTTVCGGKSLLGGAYLSSVNSYISKNFTGIAPHRTVLIGYTLYKIDNWNNESIQMIVDNDVKTTTTKSAGDGTSNICGRVSFKDQIIQVTKNFTHTATSLNLKISSTLASTPFEESYVYYQLRSLQCLRLYQLLNGFLSLQLLMPKLMSQQLCS